MSRLLLLLSIAHSACACVPAALAQCDSGCTPEGADWCSNELHSSSDGWLNQFRLVEEGGIEFEGAVTQFYQGIASGGQHRSFEYGGYGDYDIDIDFEKLTGAEGWTLELGSEHRFGESVNVDTGSILPTALALNLPAPETNDLALVKVMFSKRVSERFKIFFGKLDTLESDRNAFADGDGRDRFFNTAFNYNPAATRTIPFSTLGAGFALYGEEDPDDPILFCCIVNTVDTATTAGFDELFANGMAVFGELRIPTEFFGRSGNQRFLGSYSTASYTSLFQDTRVILPNVPITEKTSSWGIFWNADQYIYEDPQHPGCGWGVFGRAGVTDGNPNPIEWFVSFGVGGTSPIRGREADQFGIGYYYTGISNEMGPVVSSILADDQGVEMYYSYAVSECFIVSPNLQIVNPNARGTDTAVVPGIRARINF